MLNMQYDLQCLQSLFRRKMLTMPTYPYDMLCPIDGTDGFLHYVEYIPMKISLDYANAYYKKHQAKLDGGMCSGLFTNGQVLRQFDWKYDDSAQFIVKMNKDQSKQVNFSSIGMAFTRPRMSRKQIAYIEQTGAIDDYFMILPYSIVDGINERGIYAQSNVVNSENANSIDINPTSNNECCLQMMLVRVILDRLGDLDDLSSLLNSLNIYSTTEVDGYNVHLLVANESRSVVVEFENDHFEIEDFPLMSNFRTTHGFEVINKSNNDYSPIWESIEEHGQGVERWQIMSQFLKANQTNLDELRAKLNFTNAYTKIDQTISYDVWASEICNKSTLTVQQINDCHKFGTQSQHYSKCISILDKMHEAYQNRSRHSIGKNLTWQTVHSCIYDIRNRMARMRIQENQKIPEIVFWL